MLRARTSPSSTDGQKEIIVGSQALAVELVRLRADVIVTAGTPGTLAAKQATNTIPIVFASSGNPVEGRLVARHPRPGGNVTGFSFLGPEVESKRLQILKDVVPGLSRAGVMWNSANPDT
jgi:putative tryptophan/tyrosine transport system substrate-binding protein